MPDTLRPILFTQFEAALCMLNECIVKCPEEHWDGPIAKYPFWQVAYHTLCFVDVYLERTDEQWTPREGLHPAGRAELEEEYPSRRFTRPELLEYSSICRGKLRAVLGEGSSSESAEVLAGPSGFPWLRFSRAEAHLYNMRHIQHHAGQLGAFLRRAGVELRWVSCGWKELEPGPG